MKNGLKIAVILLLLTALLSGCINNSTYYFPKDGVWYCEELKMQLAFDGTLDCCVVTDDEIIPCTWEGEHGSKMIFVSRQQENISASFPGEAIFAGIYISGETDHFVLREQHGTKTYLFVKISDDERIDVQKEAWGK